MGTDTLYQFPRRRCEVPRDGHNRFSPQENPLDFPAVNCVFVYNYAHGRGSGPVLEYGYSFLPISLSSLTEYSSVSPDIPFSRFPFDISPVSEYNRVYWKKIGVDNHGALSIQDPRNLQRPWA